MQQFLINTLSFRPHLFSFVAPPTFHNVLPLILPLNSFVFAPSIHDDQYSTFQRHFTPGTWPLKPLRTTFDPSSNLRPHLTLLCAVEFDVSGRPELRTIFAIGRIIATITQGWCSTPKWCREYEAIIAPVCWSGSGISTPKDQETSMRRWVAGKHSALSPEETLL